MAMREAERGPLGIHVCSLGIFERGIRVKPNGTIRPEDLERMAKAVIQAAWKHRHNRNPWFGIWDDGTEGFNYRFDGRGGIIVAAKHSVTPLAGQLIETIRRMAPEKIRVEGEGAA